MAPEPLTDRERDLYDVLRRWVRSHGVPPTTREAGLELGISQERVQGLLQRLEGKYWIRRGEKNRARAIRLLVRVARDKNGTGEALFWDAEADK